MKIYRARQEDSEDILAWRNDPVSCSMFKSTEIVTLEEHKKWFQRILEDQNRYLFIASEGENKIGVCRFDLSDDKAVAEVSINLNPIMRGKGFSYKLLSGAISEFRKIHNVELVAIIKKVNQISVKCFDKCGFIFDREEGEYNFYKKIV